MHRGLLFAALPTALASVLALGACSSTTTSSSANTSGNGPGGTTQAGASSASGGASATGGASVTGGSASAGASGTAGGSATSGGSASSSATTGGIVTQISTFATFPATGALVSSASPDDNSNLYVTWSGKLSDNQRISAIAVLDLTTLATLKSNGSDAGAGYGAIVALPDLNKVYVGKTGEIQSVNPQTLQTTHILATDDPFDSVAAFTYDRTTHLVYASLRPYVAVIDGTTDQLVAKLSLPDAGFDGSTCAFSSSTSCLTTFGTIALDDNGQNLYFVGGDQNAYPMAGTFTLSGVDGGSLLDFLGGHAQGWAVAGHGIGRFDGGALAGMKLADGGAILVELDPGILDEVNLPTAVEDVVITTQDTSCIIPLIAFTDSHGNHSISHFIDDIFINAISDVSFGSSGGGQCTAEMEITSLTCAQTPTQGMSFGNCHDVTCVFQCQQPFASPPVGAFASTSFDLCCN